MITFKNTHITPLGAWEKHMNILLISALLLGGCKTTDPMATPVANTNYSIIDGDTIKTVVFKDYKKLKDKDPNGKNYITVGDTIVLYKEPKLHTPPAKDPDLSKLKNNDDPDLKGKPLRMVAIGGSLTAGVRDGGYFNEGILTSYPNLIARQMKLKKFEQPLFDATDYNGFGRKVRTGFNPTGGPVPKFNEVKNNSGVESVDEKGVKLKKYKTEKLDNWGVPNLLGLLMRANIKGSNNIAFKRGLHFSERFNPLRDNTTNYYYDLDLKKQKFDFFTFEIGFSEILSAAINGYAPLSEIALTSLGQPNPVKELLLELEKRNIKGCIANIPNIMDIPYFKIVSYEKLKDGLMGQTIFGLENSDVILPTMLIDSLVSTKVHIALKQYGLNGKKPIPNGNFLNKDMLFGINSTINEFNTLYSTYKKDKKIAFIDLNLLYKKISNKNFVTDDGIIVDGSFPKGNFYSSDGLNPSSFGQAVIANEFIKAMNYTYDMNIPLISTKEYLNL